MKHFYIANLFIIDVEKSSGSLSVSQGELQVERSEKKKKNSMRIGRKFFRSENNFALNEFVFDETWD